DWYHLSFYFGCEECKHKLEITSFTESDLIRIGE
ncbi:unnamed protein product, partial [marine sediment metagenome]